MQICFTKEAMEILTPMQQEMLLKCAAEKIEVSVDFSLPDDYIYVILRYHGNTTPIHGGISPEGEMST